VKSAPVKLAPVKLAMSRTRALLVAVALIVVTNALVLAGVAYNRSGEPDSVLRLTERELRIQHPSWLTHWNSNVDLRLTWRYAQTRLAGQDGPDEYFGLHWLQPEQLRELGFEVEGDLESTEHLARLDRQPSRRAWVVLEYDGPAYHARLEKLHQKLEHAASLAQAHPDDERLKTQWDSARTALRLEELVESRLLAVDAGPEAAALRARYPDRHTYAIVGGRLDVSVSGEPGRRRLIARVIAIDTDTIRVPHAFRTVIEPFLPDAPGPLRAPQGGPGFAATVHFGRRFEPWVTDFERLEVEPLP